MRARRGVINAMRTHVQKNRRARGQLCFASNKARVRRAHLLISEHYPYFHFTGDTVLVTKQVTIFELTIFRCAKSGLELLVAFKQL